MSIEPATRQPSEAHPPSSNGIGAVPAMVGAADDESDSRTVLAKIADQAGIRRVHFVAWRDLDDPEAGGSELHAHRVASLWADAGLDVSFRTSAVPGRAARVERDGYQVVRRSGRYSVFGRTAWEGLRRRREPGDALVEIWNGMPFFSPLWFKGPRVVFLHHVHAEMWRMALPGWLARIGEVTEGKLAPPLYRSSRIVTLSDSSRDEIVELLKMPPEQVTVAWPGVDRACSPGGRRSPVPLVVAVGRLVPVKRFDLLIESLVRARRSCPTLEAVIVGEGYERPALEALLRRADASDWIRLVGRVSDDELLDWYRKAWLVASSSLREGWGMTLTEAAACGTPAVATDIAGHRDAVLSGRSGLLVNGIDGLAEGIVSVVTDAKLRARLGKGALERARWFDWSTTARLTLEALAATAESPSVPALTDPAMPPAHTGSTTSG